MRSFANNVRFISSHGTIGTSSAINHRSLCDRSLLQRLLFLVLCCSSGLEACRHPPGWFHFNISPFLLHVVPNISVYITNAAEMLKKKKKRNKPNAERERERKKKKGGWGEELRKERGKKNEREMKSTKEERETIFV
jgi:hypothetical protein